MAQAQRHSGDGAAGRGHHQRREGVANDAAARGGAVASAMTASSMVAAAPDRRPCSPIGIPTWDAQIRRGEGQIRLQTARIRPPAAGVEPGGGRNRVTGEGAERAWVRAGEGGRWEKGEGGGRDGGATAATGDDGGQRRLRKRGVGGESPGERWGVLCSPSSWFESFHVKGINRTKSKGIIAFLPLL